MSNSDIVFPNYSGSIVQPALIQLSSNLIVSSFRLMKLIPAKYVIEKALAEDKIDVSSPVVETSSGTYALGLGIVCAEKKIPFFIMSDPVIDESFKCRLEELGGNVQIISGDSSQANIQVLRLEALKKCLAQNDKGFWPRQYDNIENQLAYEPFAKLLLKMVGSNFVLVGAVGSGSSTCGTINALRRINPHIELVGVDTFGSILFGLSKGTRMLRGLGNSIMPKNLVHEYFDYVHWVSAESAFKSTRELHREKALHCGPTTGAAYIVAKWIADNNKNKMVVFISADTGERYQSTVYNDEWLKKYCTQSKKGNIGPKEINLIDNVEGVWSYFYWGRRTYKQVMGYSNDR